MKTNRSAWLVGPGALWRGYTCIVSLIQQRQGSVPLNFFVTQLLKVGKQPLSLQLGYRYYADGRKAGRIGGFASR